MTLPSTPTGPDAVGLAADNPPLTWVDLVWYERQIEHWLRFGRARDEQVLDRRRRRFAFRPDDVFAFVRWRANDRGTVQSRIDILRALHPGEPGSTVPGVQPGGEVLLHISGWPRAQRVLQAIDQVEALGLDPSDVAADHWRQVHNRITARTEPEPYTLTRHRAWRRCAELMS